VHADARRERGAVAHGDDVLARPVRGGRRPAARVSRRGTVGLTPLELLAELPDLPRFDLPEELERLYGGGLGFPEPCVVANFVQTIDGIVALPELERSNAIIADGSEGDRFVMGLLRAAAGAILIGSATLLSSPTGTWLPEKAFPPAAASFAELRRRRGHASPAEIAVLTTGGSLDPAHQLLERGALILTTRSAAPGIRASVPAASEVVAVSDGDRVDPAAAIEALRRRGHSVVLSEAGPNVFGSMLAAGLVDELFLTVSPLIGGHGAGEPLSLVEGVALLPEAHVRGRLLSIRRQGEHLFVRYALR